MMDYGPDWVPPWRVGLPQARCAGRLCNGEGLPGRLVVAATLDAEGLCVNCARTPSTDEDYQLRFGVA